MNKNWFLSLILLFAVTFSAYSQPKTAPKSEFRGVWIQVIWQNQYSQMSRSEMQKYFISMLDTFQKTGINAFIFQVRPEADAFYKSKLEPTSRFFTGVQGKAPAEDWDPMEFLIKECHKRGMEFHAWLNPYRVTLSENEALSEDHIFFKHPNWFVKYGRQIYFDPALPQCREHTINVVKDIVSRYDVDGIHMDDYFYPYPISGMEFPDKESFELLAPKQGFSADQKGDWRRNNVNLLIAGIKEAIYQTKPWVRFGISPFGIYRNQKNDPKGSKTDGLENYGDLYADVLYWAEKAWIDYLIPQLYWEIGHPKADYETLIKWWNDNSKQEQLYIGESVVRTANALHSTNPKANQFPTKMNLSRNSQAVQGSCFWSGYDLLNNVGGIRDSLEQHYYRTKATVPAYENMFNKGPGAVRDLTIEKRKSFDKVTWDKPKEKDPLNAAHFYCVYRYKKEEAFDINNPNHLIGITANRYLTISKKPGESYVYVVTALNHYNFEGKPNKSTRASISSIWYKITDGVSSLFSKKK